MNNINKVQKYTKPIYNKEIRLMFTNIICDIESLQDKIIASSQHNEGFDVPNQVRHPSPSISIPKL
ncbi:MAG: hypothetical protein QNJ65_05705 [Xenococcaceae cyanobacterium MO_234.B1]|nr:hypothetical protein [Xenococcaceae cyanobacterium MO_234.B1]